MLAAATSAVTGALLVVMSTVPVEPTRPDRWDPPWLQLLVGAALVLAILAFLWWVFLVARLQDVFRDESAPRRRR